MYMIRDAGPDDFEHIWAIAREFNTVSLPANEAVIRQILDVSRRSFAGEIDPAQREYVFIMTAGDGETRVDVVGSSMITAQKGHRNNPLVYFEIEKEQKFSPAFADWLKQRREHPEDFNPKRTLEYDVIRLRHTFNGPTELGGMFVRPDYRGKRLGARLSYARLLFIAMHRGKGWFKDELLAELLPDLKDQSTPFYTALGKKFTQITYDEADKYSRVNRWFMLELFPRHTVYVKLLPQAAQDVIAKIGPGTQGAARLLTKAGFLKVNKIHPLDGGPHYEADANKVPLVTGCFQVDGFFEEDRDYIFEGLLAVSRREPPFFQCVHAEFYRDLDQPSTIRVTPRTLRALRHDEGDVLWAQPWGRKREIYRGSGSEADALPGPGLSV